MDIDAKIMLCNKFGTICSSNCWDIGINLKVCATMLIVQFLHRFTCNSAVLSSRLMLPTLFVRELSCFSGFQHNGYMRGGRGYYSISPKCGYHVSWNARYTCFHQTWSTYIALSICGIYTLNLLEGRVPPASQNFLSNRYISLLDTLYQIEVCNLICDLVIAIFAFFLNGILWERQWSDIAHLQ